MNLTASVDGAHDHASVSVMANDCGIVGDSVEVNEKLSGDSVVETDYDCTHAHHGVLGSSISTNIETRASSYRGDRL